MIVFMIGRAHLCFNHPGARSAKQAHQPAKTYSGPPAQKKLISGLNELLLFFFCNKIGRTCVLDARGLCQNRRRF
jgi:hypothetical protein